MQRTIFISSTFDDLQQHRKAVWETLTELEVAVRGMEQFGAQTGTPLQTCLAEVDQSDIDVAIIAFRLGSLEPESGQAYTQLEYERARTHGKEILIYLADKDYSKHLVKDIDQGEAGEKLDAFKRTLRDRHTVETFKESGDLATKLKRDLDRRHIEPKKLKTMGDDEFATAKMRLTAFLLLPKTLAGLDVRLKVRVSGQPYPASRATCQAFNLEFGATFGVPIEVVVPEGISCVDLFDLFVDAKHALDILPLSEGSLIEGYVKLHFSDANVGDAHARFRPKVEYPDSPFNTPAIALLRGTPVRYEADMSLALELSKTIKVTKSTALEVH